MDDDEDSKLRSVALQNVQSILQARQRAEQELIQTKEALEEERRILELLNETGAILASKLDLASVAHAVTDAGVKLSGSRFGAFFYAEGEENGNSFTLYALSGASREAFERLGDPNAARGTRPNFRDSGIVRLGDVRKDRRYVHMAPEQGTALDHLSVRSYLAVPVVSRSGEVIGGLCFGHPDCDVFTERSERLIVGIAGQAAISIDNARLYEQTKSSAEARARLLDAERAARAEGEHVNRMKDEFLATLSHELRTPMNAVLGWSDILLARSLPDSNERRGLEAISRNARAQSKLIEDLLDMNVIVSGKIRLDAQPIELVPIVEAALESIRPSADAKAIGLRTTFDPNTGRVFGDRYRLQQVVWNLLTNAVKFTPKGGKIDVLIQRVNSHVEIQVHDSGIGISPDFLPHIFERFRQADASTTRKYGGLGLGLSIVKQLVELHGGHVSVESDGQEKGATFIVSLPLRAVREAEGSSREHPTTGRGVSVRTPAVSLAGVKVLVVDDEADARELVRAVLNEAEADVSMASSAKEGLELLMLKLPDVIISDIGMPERDGYQFIQDVRKLSAVRGGRTPAIALTAFARSEDRIRALLAGYQVHVSKPIEPQELVATVKSQVPNISKH